MPHLTLQVSANGPVVDLLIGVSKPLADVLQKNGKPIPQPIQIRGLIDTGASGTCIDLQVLHAINAKGHDSDSHTVNGRRGSTYSEPIRCEPYIASSEA